MDRFKKTSTGELRLEISSATDNFDVTAICNLLANQAPTVVEMVIHDQTIGYAGEVNLPDLVKRNIENFTSLAGMLGATPEQLTQADAALSQAMKNHPLLGNSM